ncbi:MAG: hypothetical protein WDN69_22920 [Aliidongia sp.]
MLDPLKIFYQARMLDPVAGALYRVKHIKRTIEHAGVAISRSIRQHGYIRSNQRD